MKKGKVLIREKQIEIMILNGFFERLLGLIGRYPDKKLYYFPNCSSIHTFFMKTNIDVYFLSKRNVIVKKIKGIPPKRLVFGTLNSKNCIECFSNELIEIPLYEEVKIIEEEENSG